jgi:hypothetical protein
MDPIVANRVVVTDFSEEMTVHYVDGDIYWLTTDKLIAEGKRRRVGPACRPYRLPPDGTLVPDSQK